MTDDVKAKASRVHSNGVETWCVGYVVFRIFDKKIRSTQMSIFHVSWEKREWSCCMRVGGTGGEV